MEFIRLARKRGAIADVVHILFNLLLAGMTVLLVIVFPDTPWPALALLALSKWRTVAVRPRYWWMNIVSSLPDLVFGASMVLLMWLSGQNALLNGGWSWIPQLILGVIYAVWLIWIKPKTDKKWVFWQAGVSQFFAIAAIFSLASRLPLVIVVALSFIVAFGTARHIFTQFEEESQTFLALSYGFLVATIAFAAWHWTVGYTLSSLGAGGMLLEIPQVAIIISALGFAMERVYDAHETSSIKWSTVGWPLVASGLIVFLVTIVGGAMFV